MRPAMPERIERKTLMERAAESEGVEIDEKFRVGYKHGLAEGVGSAVMAMSLVLNVITGIALLALIALLVWG